MSGHSHQTLYEVATQAMNEEISCYLDLARRTNGFTAVRKDNLTEEAYRRILLGGIGSPLPSSITPSDAASEWERMQSVPFNVENAVSAGVYERLRERVAELLDEMSDDTDGFTVFDPKVIHSTPYLLPVYQRLLGAPSKSRLKEMIGAASDNSISVPASGRIAEALNQRRPGRGASVNDLKIAIEPTLEGIVRDLVGRVLLESVVANALDEVGVPYLREADYSGIEGVIYKFRADFVLPNADDPLVFIEVRKSSSRHASLYAKDKMFSAINWKGWNHRLLAVVITDGPWTEQTLQVMTKVFDYVVPLRKVAELAEIVAAYVRGDESKLRLIVNFRVTPAGQD